MKHLTQKSFTCFIPEGVMSNRHDHAGRIEKAGAFAPAFSFTPIDLLGLQKIQQVLIQLFLMRIRQSVRGAFVDDQFCVLDQRG